MSVMRCSKCDKDGDTDFEGFAFGPGLCESCWVDAGYLDAILPELEAELLKEIDKEKQ